MAEEPWQPPTFKPNDIVPIEIAFDEIDLRQKIKDVGGRWSRSAKAWKLPYKTVRALGFKSRLIDEENEKNENTRI